MAAPDPSNIRILTTLGHVDHGKTTLMDALLAANNIISTRMAGKMRYMDSREDEQERGITMESSAVSLRFQVMDKDGKSPKVYVVNMIDTPGHVDFAAEVSTAARLCDGALVLVDVVEGVCTQTIAVLRQAWLDRLRPILVINKFDRLITELQLAPVEAYHHLARLIEQVNAVMGKFFEGDRMEDDLRWREERERRMAEKKERNADAADAETDAPEEEFQEKDDEDIYFAPERGNVIFASAIDGWGFRIGKFAQLFAMKLGMKEANLRRVLWGDFYIDPKTKKVISYKHLRGRALKPLFVQFVLENIWAVYDAVVLNPNSEKVTKIVGALNLKIPPRDLKSKDGRHLLSLIFSQWLSLSTCIIQTAIDVVPAPAVSQAARMPKLLHPDAYETVIQPKNKTEEDLFASKDGPDAAVVAYVSKMFSVAGKDLPENKKRPMTADEMRAKAREAKEARLAAGNQDGASEEAVPPPPDKGKPDPEKEAADEEAEINLGFARLYSGTLSTGVVVYGVLPKYDPKLPHTHPRNAKHLVKATVEGLYVMMGRELVAVESVRPGNIFAIKGLEGKVWRSATLCAPNALGVGDGDVPQESLLNLGSVNRMAPPILRVALEPTHPADLPKLIAGLKLLSQSDPCVETFQQQTGEYVILTAGELHFERCYKDLRERFARVEIQASKPIVPFRETAVKGTDMAPPKTPNATRGTMHGSSSQGIVNFTIRASPIPSIVLDFVLQNLSVLKSLQQTGKGATEEEAEDDDYAHVIDGTVVRKPTVQPEEFWDALSAKCKEAGGEWADITDRVWSFGPQGAGGCMLIDSRKTSHASLRRRLDKTKEKQAEDEETKVIRDFDNHIETGFQLATFQGPLCNEPVEGLAYFVESLEIDAESLAKEIEQNRVAQVTGSVISAVRDACRNGLLDWSPRLMLAMYSCDTQASTEVLGKVYGVVARRRGRIVAEEMKEGTSFFMVSALIPVVESFRIADDIRKRTSGAASPQLIFAGYELLEQDPFWVPTTEEELEDLGEKADRSNIAKGYVDAVDQTRSRSPHRSFLVARPPMGTAVAGYNGLNNSFLSSSSITAVDEVDEQFTTLFCRALYDYTAQDGSALSFRQNDIIEVLTQQPSGWWDGLLGDERGWFPSNYVTIISDEEAELAFGASEFSAAPEQRPTADTTADNASMLDMSHAMMRGTQAENEQWLDTELGGIQPGLDDLANASFASAPVEHNDFWMPEVTADGQIYYVNTKTGQRARDLPSETDSEASDSDFTGLASQSSSRSGTSAGLGLTNGANGVPQGSRDMGSTAGFGLPRRTTTPEPWVKKLADDGMSYYYWNTSTNSVQWTRPEPEVGASSNNATAHTRDRSTTRPLPSTSALASSAPSVPTATIRPLPSTRHKQSTLSVYSDNSDIIYPAESNFARQNGRGPVDVKMELTAAERIAQSLQQALAPPPAELVTDLSAVARSAIQSVVENVDAAAAVGRRLPGEEQRMDELVSGVVFAVRNLLYVAAASIAQIPPNVLPRSMRHTIPASERSSPLKPAQRKVTATLSRLVLSARALQYDAGSTMSDTLDRIQVDAEELDRAVHSFVLEVQRANHTTPDSPSEKTPKRLHGVFVTANLGLGLFGAGAAASWKGFGWVSLQDDDAPREPLSTNVVSDLTTNVQELDRYFKSLEEAVRAPDASSMTVIHTRTRVLIAQISSYLKIASNVHVARHVDIDGIRQEAGAGPNENYLQTVDRARTLIRTLEFAMQSLYDESMSLLMTAQSLRQIEPGQSYEAQDLTLDHLQMLSVSLRANLQMAHQTFEALLVLGQEQADVAQGDYNGSIDWRMSRLSVIDATLGGALRPMSMISNNGDMIDLGDAFGSKQRDRRPLPAESFAQHRANGGGSMSSTFVDDFEDDTIINDSPRNRDTGSPTLDDEFDDERVQRKPRRNKDKLADFFGAEFTNGAPRAPPPEPEAPPKPWYLQPAYSPTENIIDDDGSIRAASVPALVERLTAHEQGDPSYIKGFLMTFKSFTSVDDLFDLLAQRFWIQPPPKLTTAEREEWGRLKQHIIRARVLNTFKSMITDDDVLEKDDLFILERIKEFVTTDEVAQFPAAKQLLILIERAQKGGDSMIKMVSAALGAPPPPLVPKSSKKLRLLDIEPLELARQFTIMESQLYQRIRPMECLQRAREQRTENIDNITVVIQTSNKIALWVAESILSKEDSRKRASVVKHLISVADRCRTLNNFSTMSAITAGLNTPPIRRLKRTWEQVNQRAMAQFGACELTIDSNKSFNKYKQLMTSVVPPCVPFIGVFLTTLQFIHDGNPDNLPGPPPAGAPEGTPGMSLVNFRKRQMAAEVISDIKRWQVPFNLHVIPSVQAYIEESLNAVSDTKESSERFWNMSLEREPREREDEKMARLLQESGFL
uniref:Elongation factor 2 n=1 Tax=Mycena chlorophos TaxID=658473 RepID=A0ABQ0LHP9_MYCCL|nr:predicted protein [Mycena chlorophos]